MRYKCDFFRKGSIRCACLVQLLDFIQLVKRVCICFMNNFPSMLVQYCCCSFKHSSWNWNENYSEINQTDNVDGVARRQRWWWKVSFQDFVCLYFSISTFSFSRSLSKYWNLSLSLLPLFPFPICACIKLHTLTSFYILVIEMTHTLSHTHTRTQMQTQNHLEML